MAAISRSWKYAAQARPAGIVTGRVIRPPKPMDETCGPRFSHLPTESRHLRPSSQTDDARDSYWRAQ